MKIICLLLIFGIISCKVDPTQTFDIWYNYEYNLKTYLGLEYPFYAFRLPVNYVGKMDIEVKINTFESQHNFAFRVFQYNYEATPDDILNDRSSSLPDFLGKDSYEEGKYTVYRYTFVSKEGGMYFGIKLELPVFTYNYIIFRVNSRRYQYSNVKELSLNQDYPIDTSIFGDRKVPQGYHIYIRIPSFSEDNMEIQLTTHKVYNRANAFQVDVCQYDNFPTESQVYYGDPGRPCDNNIENVSKEDKKFVYKFSTESKINYLSIRIINNQQDLNYLNIFIYSETGMAVALLVVVIVLPILAVGAIGYFLFKKFCGGS